ncbi:NAD(P)-dependent oxidoreductase [Candidatus Pacearchaeota archaeon]|nr:NAD(P)-dependent oxidoreductase [Candidatus Pacearchaeota archaeon]
MKVLVLGGAGYIGGVTSDVLSINHEVTVYDNLLYEDRYFKRLNFVNGDIRDTKKVVNSAEGCDVVVLLAALVGDGACAVNPGLTEEINFLAVKNICEQLPKEKKIIFMSTASVYGANEELVDEIGPTKPLSIYASTKLRAEKYVLERGGVVFRLGTVFGVGDQYSRIRSDLVVNTLTIKAFVENKIVVNGGNQYRPLISVRDVAYYLAEACESPAFGLFNLAYKNATISSIADDIFLVFPNVEIKRTDILFEDERNYKVNTQKARNTFSYTPIYSVLSEIKNMAMLLYGGRIKNPNSVVYNNGMYLSNMRI